MNVLVLFLFPDRTHVLDICENRLTEAILTNIQSMLLGFNAIFLHDFSLTVTS